MLIGVVLLVVLSVHELGDDLSGMAGRVEVVSVLVDLLLGALLAAVSGEDVLVVVEVVVVVLVKEGFGHIYVWRFVNIIEITGNFVAVATDNVTQVLVFTECSMKWLRSGYIGCQQHVTRMRVDKILEP